MDNNTRVKTVVKYTYENKLEKQCVGYADLTQAAGCNISITAEDKEIALIMFPFSYHELHRTKEPSQSLKGKLVDKERSMMTPYSVVISDPEGVEVVKAYWESRV